MEIKLELDEKEAQQLMELVDYWADVAHDCPDTDEDMPSEQLCDKIFEQINSVVPFIVPDCDCCDCDDCDCGDGDDCGDGGCDKECDCNDGRQCGCGGN